MNWPNWSTRKWGYLVVGLVALVLMIVPFWQIIPYFEISSSSLKLSLSGDYIINRLNLSAHDQMNLSILTKQLHIDWSGQDFAWRIGQETQTNIAKYLPLEVGLSLPDSNDLKILTSNVKLPPGLPGFTNEGLEYLPNTTIAVLRMSRLQDQYQLDGKAIFQFVADRGTLGISLTDKIGLIWVGKITDENGLNKVLASLKNIQVKPISGYSGDEAAAAGFIEQKIGNDTVYILNQPGLLYQPTFGKADGYLIVASTPDLWQQSRQSPQGKFSFKTSANYQQVKDFWPAVSSGSIYLDLRALAGRGVQLQQDLTPFFKLNLSPQLLGYGVDTGKLHLLTAAWVSLSSESKLVPSRLVINLTLK